MKDRTADDIFDKVKTVLGSLFVVIVDAIGEKNYFPDQTLVVMN